MPIFRSYSDSNILKNLKGANMIGRTLDL